VYESLFSDTPVIVSAENIGVNREHINPQTGVFATDEELSGTLLRVISESGTLTPRAWALRHTGYRNSTGRLTEFARDLAIAQGETWTSGLFAKMNRPNAIYADADTRAEAREHFAALDEYLRPV
jgi:hypothetical protein